MTDFKFVNIGSKALVNMKSNIRSLYTKMYDIKNYSLNLNTNSLLGAYIKLLRGKPRRIIFTR